MLRLAPSFSRNTVDVPNVVVSLGRVAAIDRSICCEKKIFSIWGNTGGRIFPDAGERSDLGLGPIVALAMRQDDCDAVEPGITFRKVNGLSVGCEAGVKLEIRSRDHARPKQMWLPLERLGADDCARRAEASRTRTVVRYLKTNAAAESQSITCLISPSRLLYQNR